MKRRTSRAMAAGAAVGVATALAAGSASAGPVFHLSFQGRVAIAVWTSCPHPEVGDSCFDTVVIASDAKTYENNDQEAGGHFLHDKGDRVILRHFWYDVREVDGEVWPVPTRESFGGTDVANVDIHNRLTAAVAAAPHVPMHTTDYVNETEYDEPGSISATWSPAGPLSRITARDRASTRDYFFMESTLGWERAATAAGVDDGVPITRPLVAADTSLTSVHQVALSVYKGHLDGAEAH